MPAVQAFGGKNGLFRDSFIACTRQGRHTDRAVQCGERAAALERGGGVGPGCPSVVAPDNPTLSPRSGHEAALDSVTGGGLQPGPRSQCRVSVQSREEEPLAWLNRSWSRALGLESHEIP